MTSIAAWFWKVQWQSPTDMGGKIQPINDNQVYFPFSRIRFWRSIIWASFSNVH